jgi:8-oxo-dGTP diphosphatase
VAASEDISDTYLPVVAVNGIMFDGMGRVLLTRRMDNGLWCLPGGLLEFGETVQEGLVREIEDEIGIRPTELRLTGVYSSNNKTVVQTAKRCSIILAFTCETGGQIARTSEEVQAVEYFHLDGLPEGMVENHERRIRDAALQGIVLPVVD